MNQIDNEPHLCAACGQVAGPVVHLDELRLWLCLECLIVAAEHSLRDNQELRLAVGRYVRLARAGLAWGRLTAEAVGAFFGRGE